MPWIAWETNKAFENVIPTEPLPAWTERERDRTKMKKGCQTFEVLQAKIKNK